MGQFRTPLDLRDIGLVNGRPSFQLLEDFCYEVGAEGSGLLILVPKGFITDFASIPRPFWIVLPPYGKYNKAAVVHDWLYKKESGFTKVVADAIFYEAMESLGVPFTQRWLMFKAVEYFGKSAYNWDQKPAETLCNIPWRPPHA